MRGRIAHLSAHLATLTARWGERFEVVRDLQHGGFAVWRVDADTALARGETPEDAVTAALALWPRCSECGNGVGEDVAKLAWPVCGACPETR